MMFRSVVDGTIIRNEPAYRPRPVMMPGYHKFSNGDYDAFVVHRALEAIANKARQAAPNEMIGYLLGRPFRDAKELYAVVTEAVFAQSARCGPVTVETTLDDERGLLETLLCDHPLAERLGWFHSHPFWRPSYSATDRENQRFWSESYQLGLLAYFDPAGSVSIVAFRGPEAEAIHPPYTTSCNVQASCAPTLPPVLEIEHCQTAPEMAQPTQQALDLRPSLALLTLAVGVVWPIAYLMGVWMIVQEMQEGQDSAAQPAVVTKDQAPLAPELSHRPPVKKVKTRALKVATPAKPVKPPTPKLQQPDIGDQ